VAAVIETKKIKAVKIFRVPSNPFAASGKNKMVLLFYRSGFHPTVPNVPDYRTMIGYRKATPRPLLIGYTGE
jgi:hypothetical protein